MYYYFKYDIFKFKIRDNIYIYGLIYNILSKYIHIVYHSR